MKRNWMSRAPTVLAGALLCLGCATGAQAQVTLNFVNADIDQVAKAIGAATGRTIIVDPRVKGQINLVSERPVDKEIAFKTLQSTLRMQGYVLLDDHGVYKVVPEADAKLEGVPTGVGNNPQYHGDQIVTQIFKLQYESANNLLPVLRPLIAPNNAITAYPANNTLVVTDYADNVRRIASIISNIDSPGSSPVEIVQLHNASATDVATMLTKMLDPNATGGNDATLKINVTADPRTNSIMLRASNGARVQVAKSLIQKLDEPTHGAGNIHVVHLRNADAAKLAATMRAILGTGGGGTSTTGKDSTGQSGGLSGSSTSTGSAGVPPLPTGLQGSTPTTSGGSSSGSSAGLGQGGPSFSSSDNEATATGGIVQADVATNSLVITAPDPVYRNLKNVIDELDARRAQVYIESLIVEVTADNEGALGIQWQGVVSNKANNTGIYAGTNFNTAGQNILDISAGAAAAKGGNASSLVLPDQGLNVGILHKFGSILGLGGLVQALDTLSGVNVLSTPNLITLDNEEAKIVIGQNVPFITGSYAQTGTTATVTPFQTYDREDVGITLRVKPQITEGGTVKLQIYQESSSVVANTANDPGGVTTNKRSLQSTVMCDNGQIIVLGGLIQDEYDGSNSKVPLLGDLPFVGPLFRYENRSHIKTNLMVFLRPVVIRDSATSADISQNRYDLMRHLSETYDDGNRMLKSPDTPIAPATSTLPNGLPVPDKFLDPVPRVPPDATPTMKVPE
ncbi:MAG: type II secretion system secretin GspD [Burkholderiaceae bacterium]